MASLFMIRTSFYHQMCEMGTAIKGHMSDMQGKRNRFFIRKLSFFATASWSICADVFVNYIIECENRKEKLFRREVSLPNEEGKIKTMNLNRMHLEDANVHHPRESNHYFLSR